MLGNPGGVEKFVVNWTSSDIIGCVDGSVVATVIIPEGWTIDGEMLAVVLETCADVPEGRST